MANYKIQMKKKVGDATYDNLYPVTYAEYVQGFEQYKLREATTAEYASTTYINYAKVYFLQKSINGGVYTDVLDTNNNTQPILVPKDQFIDSATIAVASSAAPITYNDVTYTNGETFIKMVFVDTTHSTIYIPISDSIQVTTYAAGNDGVVFNTTVTPNTISHKLGITAQTITNNLYGVDGLGADVSYIPILPQDHSLVIENVGTWDTAIGTIKLATKNKTYDNYGHLTSITDNNSTAILRFAVSADHDNQYGEVRVTSLGLGPAGAYSVIGHTTHQQYTPTVPSNATLSMGGTFWIPYLTTNPQGHVIAAQAVTYTMPSLSSMIDGTSLVITNNKITHATSTPSTSTASSQYLYFGDNTPLFVQALSVDSYSHVSNITKQALYLPELRVDADTVLAVTGVSASNIKYLNLGAYFVRHDTATQGLTDTGKKNARTNINAVAVTVGTTDSSNAQIGDLWFDTTI